MRSIEEIRALVGELRALGVTSYKDGDLELHLGPAPAGDDIPSERPKAVREEPRTGSQEWFNEKLFKPMARRQARASARGAG